jgi:hypothetical protein
MAQTDTTRNGQGAIEEQENHRHRGQGVIIEPGSLGKPTDADARASVIRPHRGLAACSIALLLVVVLALAGCGGSDDAEDAPIPDLSGLAWLGGDRFLAVHDAKNPDENDRPRLTLLRLPSSLAGIEASEVEVEWPGPQGKSNDLESADRIPGSDQVLFAESGDDGGDFQRIFFAEQSGDEFKIVSSTPWPEPVQNVEGIAVARVGARLVFLYAERAQGKPSTDIAWAPLRLDPPRFGAFRRVAYSAPRPSGPNARPVSALTVDTRGRIYAASAFDPDVDAGPFKSFVWRIGELRSSSAGQPRVVLADRPELVGALDGFKVESVAVRGNGDGGVVLAGTDDEYYGGALRPLPGSP